MADFNLDRIRFRWKSDWLGTTTYTKDDMVYYKGKTYACITGHTSTTFFDTEYGITPRHSTVTVVDNKFYINNTLNPTLDLRKGDIYNFDLSHSSLAGTVFSFSNAVDGPANGGVVLLDGVTTVGTPGTVGASLTIIISDNTLSANYYNQSSTGYGNTTTVTAAKWRLVHDGCEWKGDWGTTVAYSIGDIVKFKGYVYQCTQTHTSNPVNNLGLTTDIKRWKLLATTYNWTSVWVVDYRYELGDVVRYNGIIYNCNTKHTSSTSLVLGLEADQASWDIVSTADEWRSAWTINTRYKVGDFVKYGAISYRCLTAHTSAASLLLGLETDQAKWEIVNSGIEYKFNWGASYRYKKNDIVKYGQSLYICTTSHTSGTLFRPDETEWLLWLPGLGFEEVWSSSTEYTIGDIVLHGGYTYTALENSLNSNPSADGLLQNTGNWELLNPGFKHRGEWDNTTAYLTGDVIRNNGQVYVAIDDNSGIYPDVIADWKLVIPGDYFTGTWNPNNEYYIGDIALYNGTSYVSILRHNSSVAATLPTTDVGNTDTYWKILVQGTPENRLNDRGDLLTYTTEKTALTIGTPGTIIKSSGTESSWGNFGLTTNVYFVSVEGEDTAGSGFTDNAPFRTVKYACDYILADEAARAPATIYIKTGIYEEILPITIPATVALVGDELRSTVIQAASGYETANMFYVRNGTGIRNMTLQGLSGTLGSANIYGTSRPTAGAYVSLDSGTGVDDTSVWIQTKSPYIQNVTTFGTGCIGLKIDGAIHNGGNKSVVANDFTQVLNDGIGVWVEGDGVSELVSVFTYFCHIGYLATIGGKIRATNGNNSYGTFGSVAESVNQVEEFIGAQIDNRRGAAEIGIVHNNGNQIMSIGYKHAGQTYSTATLAFSGSGINAAATATFVDGAVSNVRIQALGDSTIPGGLNYTSIPGGAQAGTTTTITLDAADLQTDAAQYIGQRIFITSGAGVGQYGYIQAYVPATKQATIYKESTGTIGWDTIDTSFAIETTLNLTTKYQIEPRITFAAPTSGTTAWGRAIVVASRISEIYMYEPGSGYTSAPVITVVDNVATTDASFEVYVNDGVLGKPTFTNRGTGYIRSTAAITGNGYAEKYQLGSLIKVKGLTRTPGPGDNVEIFGINDQVYRLVKVQNVTGSIPALEADVYIYPTLKVDESPAHNSAVTIRQFYSQVRLTGHDFLDIGTGNVSSTKYPNLYLDGIDSDNTPQQQNEAVEADGGRVFYTSTDQDGNFRAGELFQVEQSSGIVTVNASTFNLSGLTELSLGGIQVGGSVVVIREFSKDGTFVANSNNIVPTQAAIIKYLTSRISGGSTDATTNKVTAGQIVVETNNISSNIDVIEIPSKVNLTGGMGGDMVAMQYFRHISQRGSYS